MSTGHEEVLNEQAPSYLVRHGQRETASASSPVLRLGRSGTQQTLMGVARQEPSTGESRSAQLINGRMAFHRESSLRRLEYGDGLRFLSHSLSLSLSLSLFPALSPSILLLLPSSPCRRLLSPCLSLLLSRCLYLPSYSRSRLSSRRRLSLDGERDLCLCLRDSLSSSRDRERDLDRRCLCRLSPLSSSSCLLFLLFSRLLLRSLLRWSRDLCSLFSLEPSALASSVASSSSPKASLTALLTSF